MSDTPEQTNLSLDTPGQILRDARIAKQLEQTDVSQQLRLNIDIINAVEKDDYEFLSVPTYVRGYLRSYAKLVDVDDESLISLYNSFLENDDDPEIIPEVSQKSQISSSDKPVKIVTYLIAFGLILLLLAWWQSKYMIDEDLNIVATESETATEVLTNNKTNEGVPPAFDYNYSIVTHSDTPSIDVTVQNDISTSQDMINDLSDIIQTSDAANALVDTVSDSSITNSSQSSGATGKLRLIVDKESWIEVYNTNERKLFQKLAQPGSVVNITGLTPLSVLIGFAEGVRVEFDGKSIDTVPFTRANVARLKLGE